MAWLVTHHSHITRRTHPPKELDSRRRAARAPICTDLSSTTILALTLRRVDPGGATALAPTSRRDVAASAARGGKERVLREEHKKLQDKNLAALVRLKTANTFRFLLPK